MPKYENIKLELRFDAFNVFNHTNATLFNTNDVLNVMAPSVTNAGNDQIRQRWIPISSPAPAACGPMALTLEPTERP